MKRLAVPALAALCVCALCGCYESPVPLASSSASAIDARLVGWWQSVEPPEHQGVARLLVLPFNEHEYYVELREANRDGTGVDTTRLRVFSTRIDGATFGNAQVIDLDEALDDARSFVFFRYDLTDEGLLRLRYVSEKLFERSPTTSEALFGFVRTHLGNEALYEDEAVWFEKRRE